MRRTLRVAVALAALVLLGACGGGDDVQTATAEDAPSTTTTTSTTTPPETTTTALPATTVATTPPTTAAHPATGSVRDHGPTHFRSPTGNIGCMFHEATVRCDIQEHDWKPPPRPASCDHDWGSAFFVDSRGARHICYGDTVLGADEVLEYGTTAVHDGLQCTSERSGMTCRHLRTGRGFTVARASYRFF